MEAVALKAVFAALETFGPGAVMLAGLVYLVWRGEAARATKTGDAEAKLLEAIDAVHRSNLMVAASNEKQADNFERNIRVVENICGHIDEIKAVLHRMQETAAEMKGAMK